MSRSKGATAISDEMRARIIELWRKGQIKQSVIAARVGVSRASVCKIVKAVREGQPQ